MKLLAVSLAAVLVGLCWEPTNAQPTPPAASPVESAPEGAVDPAKSDVHRNKARILIDQKNWAGAAEEIRLATKFNPKSADAWLILGTVTMRLETSDAEALAAFNKYLEFNPPADKAAAVRQRIAELEVRLDKQRKIDEENVAKAAKAKANRFGPGGSGFYVGFSPSYNPKIGDSSDLNSSISSSFDFGFRIQMVDVGLRFGSGTVDRISVKDESNALIPAPSSGAYNSGKHTLTELYTRINFALNAPQEGKAGSRFLIPLHIGRYLKMLWIGHQPATAS